MWRSYELKWCLILMGILSASTLLLRLDHLDEVSIGQVIRYPIAVSVYILACWLIHAYFRVHVFAGMNNKARSFISITAGIVAALSLGYLYAFLMPANKLINDIPLEYSFVNVARRLMAAFFLSMICFVVFNVIYTGNLLQTAKIENEQLKQADLRAQLTALQQQLSPHFLFNSLSTLKTIAQDAETKHFIVQLSHVYRYLLSFNKRQVAKLSEELAFVRSYLYILQQRFEDALSITIEVPARYDEYLIPPLSLQLLIENAVKHNAFSQESPLIIVISVTADHSLLVKNNK